MKILTRAIIATLCLILQLPQAQAKPAKPQQVQKEPLVLMPLRLAESEQNLQGAMETALIEGLAKKYKVYSGEQVAKKAREIFAKESKNTAHKECDETRCLQGIAESFQSELLAIANVTKQEGGYFLALSIRNIFDNQDVYSKSLPCKGCDAFQVVEKLKELIEAPTNTVAPSAESTQPKITATDPDSLTWAEAQKGNTADDYQVYLDAYPQGKYVAFAKSRLGKLKVVNKEAKGSAMVRIPGKNYEIGKYEVTQKEWHDIMGSNPSNFSSCGDDCPVENVNWNDIQEFLQKLNAKSGRTFRLPTVAEWEYACYGGSETEYCGSNDINSVAWYKDNSNGATHPVGQKQANGYGLYDMSGNVWEWMQDWYDNSHYGRTLRGGSWYNEPSRMRAALRSHEHPANRFEFIGFRLARTLP